VPFLLVRQFEQIIEDKFQRKDFKKNEKITLTGPITQQKYPEELRLITYYDKQKDKIYQFLTNNFHLSLIL